MVELAWRATFRLQIWAPAPVPVQQPGAQRTVVVDLLFPRMLPSASLSQGMALVSLFNTGYRAWAVGLAQLSAAASEPHSQLGRLACHVAGQVSGHAYGSCCDE